LEVLLKFILSNKYKSATKPKNKLAQAGWRMIKNKATDSKSKNKLTPITNINP
jgi:hypothetical protein